MFWRKKRPWSDFAEEVQSHLAHEADQLQERGVAPANAANLGSPGVRKLHFDTGRGLSSAAGFGGGIRFRAIFVTRSGCFGDGPGSALWLY